MNKAKTYLKGKMKEFRRLKRSRQISIVMLIVIIIAAQVGVVLYLVASAETLAIIENTIIPSGTVNINFDTTHPDDMEVRIPYTVQNPGTLDLTAIMMTVNVKVVYVHDVTKEVIVEVIFSKTELLGTCIARNALVGEFWGDYFDFDTGALGRFFLDADGGESWGMLGDIIFSAAYFSNLVHFDVIQNDIIFA